MKTLHHFSSVDTLNPFSVEQTGRRMDKPDGLWVSDENVESSWSEWAKAEDWNIGKYRFEILVDDTNLLLLESKSDILCFTKEYEGKNDLPFLHPSHSIKWTEVARKYDGILITPYIWACRLNEDTNWYYGWDCASGCIWNKDSIIATKGEK